MLQKCKLLDHRSSGTWALYQQRPNSSIFLIHRSSYTVLPPEPQLVRLDLTCNSSFLFCFKFFMLQPVFCDFLYTACFLPCELMIMQANDFLLQMHTYIVGSLLQTLVSI
ncbi:hypothetical protein V8G54_031639, partial [Vigna mungo]